MLIISDDSYFSAGLHFLINRYIPADSKGVIFDAGGQCVYIMNISFIHNIRFLDALSALLTNKYTLLPKNSSANEYIRTIKRVCGASAGIKTSPSLSPLEMAAMRLLAFTYSGLSIPADLEGKREKWSFHKRNALKKLQLKNDTIFYSVLATWRTCGISGILPKPYVVESLHQVPHCWLPNSDASCSLISVNTDDIASDRLAST